MNETSRLRDALMKKPRHFVGGQFVAPSQGQTLRVEDPSTEEEIGAIAAGGAKDVSLAVDAARQAMVGTRKAKWTAAARGEALWALADRVVQHSEELAWLETIDAGKPIANTRRIDIPGAASALRYFAGWATKITGETMEMSQPGGWHGHTRREPVGVVGQINPWNFPLMGAAFKIGPAIAAGCATVLKPAEQASLSSLRLAELAMECGFPPGFFNVVTGTGEEAGAALVDHPDIAKIGFTGSTEVGRRIAAACGRHLKRVTVELGGKSPVLVLPDADIDAAAREIATSIFFNSGQTCSAGSRLFVHASVADDLIAKIAAVADGMRIGSAHDPQTQIGPLISQRQRDKVRGFVEDAMRAGARISSMGRLPSGKGWFVEPTIIRDAGPETPAVTEEIFGPILCAFPFETEDLDEIARMANDTRYGLAAYVWTRDISKAFGLADRIEAGTLRINSSRGADLSLPAGGVKQSGFGRENGREGVEAYTELKTVTVAY